MGQGTLASSNFKLDSQSSNVARTGVQRPKLRLGLLRTPNPQIAARCRGFALIRDFALIDVFSLPLANHS